MYEETLRLLEIPSVKALVPKALFNNFILSSLFTDKKDKQRRLFIGLLLIWKYFFDIHTFEDYESSKFEIYAHDTWENYSIQVGSNPILNKWLFLGFKEEAKLNKIMMKIGTFMY